MNDYSSSSSNSLLPSSAQLLKRSNWSVSARPAAFADDARVHLFL